MSKIRRSITEHQNQEENLDGKIQNSAISSEMWEYLGMFCCTAGPFWAVFGSTIPYMFVEKYFLSHGYPVEIAHNYGGWAAVINATITGPGGLTLGDICFSKAKEIRKKD